MSKPAEACQGELIVLTDGDKQVTREPHMPLDLEKDSPELEAELLKAIDGLFSPYSAEKTKETKNKQRASSCWNPALRKEQGGSPVFNSGAQAGLICF